MSIKLGQNIQSIGAQRQLDISSQKLATVYERLSSGQRINRAADDAAGLAIADSLNAKTRIYTQALRNANDGQSALSIADSAYGALSDITIRLRELSEQSATGTFSSTQRESLDNEAQALKAEFERITATTSFNGISLLDGSLVEGMRLQLGVGEENTLLLQLGGTGNGTAGSVVGTGTFGTSVSYPSANFTQAITLGDLNGDNILDIASTGQGIAVIRLGLGDGSFGTATSYTGQTTFSRHVILADLDDDTDLDMITFGTSAGLARIAVRLGAGDGTFGALATYDGIGSLWGGDTGDINGDDVPDMIVIGNAGGNDYTSVRLGLGDGSFGAITTTFADPEFNYDSASALLIDIDNDNILDMVTSGFGLSGGKTTIRLGVGNGTFGASATYDSASAEDVTFGDLDGDNDLDLVVVGLGTLSVREGAGDGTFGAITTYAVGVNNNDSLSLSDLNGDGALDVVIAGRSSGIISVKLGNGDGTFGNSTTYNTGTAVLPNELRDLDGDGVVDLAVASGSGVSILLANTEESTTTGAGALSLQEFSLRTQSSSLQAMDMLDETLSALSAQRGIIGALQSRLTVAADTIIAQTEQFRSAESRIRDADMAQEAAELSRVQILQQAGASVLAQANQAPALALVLLR